MLADVIGCLACPVCGAVLVAREGSLACASGHAFDVARQGYVNLLAGGARHGTADTAAMLDAREAFLAAGHFEPIAGALAEAVEAAAPGDGCVAEVGAGTGAFLAAVLDAMPGRRGIALDVSKVAARRAAHAHARAGAVVADVWAGLPLADGCAAVVLDVFAPRNAAEFARVLAPDGVLAVVTPTARHLAEAAGPLGLIGVQEEKRARTDERLAERFTRTGTRLVETPMALSHADLAALAAMGPSAHHTSPEAVARAVALLPEPFAVTLSVEVATYRPC